MSITGFEPLTIGLPASLFTIELTGQVEERRFRGHTCACSSGPSWVTRSGDLKSMENESVHKRVYTA